MGLLGKITGFLPSVDDELLCDMVLSESLLQEQVSGITVVAEYFGYRLRMPK